MASANGTIVSHCAYDGAWHDYNTDQIHYVGYNYYSDWYPYILKFKTPSFTGKSSALTFNLSILQGNRNNAKSSETALRWALCKSDGNKNSYLTSGAVTDTNQITSGTVTFTGLSSAYAVKTLTVSTAALSSNTTYYLVLWGAGGYDQDYARVNTPANHSVTLTYVNTYVLSISQGTGSIITVKKGSTTLTDGATITYGDVLTITFGASTGYNLGTHTVNGSTFTSGGNHTVTSNVAVVATASLKTYKLSISAGTGSVISVKRNGTALSNGATLTYGDEITITFAASTGYKLTYTSHTSGNTYTVTAAVNVSATAAVLSYLLSINQGEGTTVTVKRTNSPKQGAATGALASGAAIYYSDVLEITITAKGGYKLSSATVNGAAFTSGNSHTVVGAVNVAAVALLYAYLIGSGASQRKYVAQIKSGGVVKTYVGYIKRGGQWYPCGQ